MFLRWLDMGIIRSFFCSTMGVIQLKLRFMMGHTTSSRTGITPDWLRLFTMGKGNYSHTRYVCMPVDIIIKGLHNCRDSNRKKKRSFTQNLQTELLFFGSTIFGLNQFFLQLHTSSLKFGILRLLEFLLHLLGVWNWEILLAVSAGEDRGRFDNGYIGSRERKRQSLLHWGYPQQRWHQQGAPWVGITCSYSQRPTT